MEIDSREIGQLASVGLRVLEVDGGAVRTRLNVEFALAGNPGRYPDMIPADELWLDRCLDTADAAATIVHEAVEYALMAAGASYNDAHETATAAELPMRLAMEGEDVGEEDPVELADAWLVQHGCTEP